MPIADPLPPSLFHTGRAPCPDCGAALALVDHLAFVRCQYCGGTSVVERRLRNLEPVISQGFVTADAPLDTARFIEPSQVIDAVAQDESHCPTCGFELGPTDTQAIRKCSHCGTQCKIERRLLRSPEADLALIEMESRADESERRRFDATEKLIDIVEKGTGLADRVTAARELGEMWIHALNARAARLLPHVMKVLRGCDARLEIPLAEIVGKLLCNDDIVLANAVLRAAEKFVFDVDGSQALLRMLSLGDGIGLKLLLDTADFAGTRGATEYACSALWGVNTMIERNYAGRMRLAEIVLYRLLYLKGPVQAWAIELAKGQLGLGCRFPTPTLLHFIDDCAAERPELIKHVHACFYGGVAAAESEYIKRIEMLNELQTAPAKVAALERLYAPPADMAEATAAEVLRRLVKMTSDPQLAPGAIKAIIEWIEDAQPRACVEGMVRGIGDNLPEEIRRAYLRVQPKSPLLSPMKVKYVDVVREEPTAFDRQLEQWRQMWDAGIRGAVARQEQRRNEAREYWEGL